MAKFSFSSLTDTWLRSRNQLAARWKALSLRERRLLGLTGTLLGLYLTVQVLILPAWETLQQARNALPLAQSHYAQVQALTQSSLALQGQRSGTLNAEAQYTLLESSLQQAGLVAELHRKETGIHVDWAPSRASLILDWLVQLPSLVRLQPLELDLVRQQDESGSWLPGLVSGHAVLGSEPRP